MSKRQLGGTSLIGFEGCLHGATACWPELRPYQGSLTDLLSFSSEVRATGGLCSSDGGHLGSTGQCKLSCWQDIEARIRAMPGNNMCPVLRPFCFSLSLKDSDLDPKVRLRLGLSI